MTEIESYEIIIIGSWNILKLLSFTLDCVQASSKITGSQKSSFSIVNLLGYMFYIPNMLVGPIIIYARYAEMLTKDARTPLSDSLQRAKLLLLNIARVGLWLAFNDFALHFIYVSNLTYNPQVNFLFNSYIKGLKFWIL